MPLRRVLAAAFLMLLTLAGARADEFNITGTPDFAAIRPRQVYGFVVFDMTFLGDNKKNSAERFLKNIVESRYSKETGNYILTIEATLNGQRVIAEPLISARWERDKFLVFTTSEKSVFEAKRDGLLLNNIVVDNDTNRLELSIKAYYSNQLNIDIALFKEISDLSKTATVSAFAPGLSSVSSALESFTPLLGKLLDRYKESQIVETKTGVFTLLDGGFGNVLNYRDSRVSVNIYLKTQNSQIESSFKQGKFVDPDHELALITLKAGAGAARALVTDIIAADTSPGGAPLAKFLNAIVKSEALTVGADRASIAPSCGALKARFNGLLNTRDASLLYWAFLKRHREELQTYPDGAKCGAPILVESLANVGLAVDPAEWPQQ